MAPGSDSGRCSCRPVWGMPVALSRGCWSFLGVAGPRRVRVLAGGVFGVAVEAFDGVAQGGVAGVPGRAAVGEVLAVAGAGVRGMVIAVCRQAFGGSWRGGEYLGPPVTWL